MSHARRQTLDGERIELGEINGWLGFLLRIHHELYGGQPRLVQRGYVR